jgi:hypothetical protein
MLWLVAGGRGGWQSGMIFFPKSREHIFQDFKCVALDVERKSLVSSILTKLLQWM